MFDSKFVREKTDNIINKGMQAFLGVVNTEAGKVEKHLLDLESRMDISVKDIEDLEIRLANSRRILGEYKADFDEYHKVLNKIKKINLRM